jgi:hypothetical protein
MVLASELADRAGSVVADAVADGDVAGDTVVGVSAGPGTPGAAGVAVGIAPDEQAATAIDKAVSAAAATPAC